MSENEKKVFEILNEYANNLNSREISSAKSKLKKELINILIDELVSQGYKRDKAEAIVGFVTRDAKKDVDYSEMLDTFGGNIIIDKISELPLKSIYNFYLTFDKYNDNIETFIVKSYKLMQQLEENGQYDYQGQKALVDLYNAFLDTTIKLLSYQPLANNAYKTYIQYIGMEASELANILIDAKTALKMGEFVAYHANQLPLSFNSLIQNSMWEKGPSLEELENMFNGMYGDFSEEDLKLFEPYISWRYMYEVEQELDKSGISIDEYNEMMERLNEEDPSMWEVLWNLLFGDVVTSEAGAYAEEDVIPDSDETESTTENTDSESEENPTSTDTAPTDETTDDTDVTDNQELPKITKEDIIKIVEEAVENTDSVEDIDTRITQIVRIVKEQVIAASAATYDPLILDLDGDGFNVELKENGTNFDLDTNSFAEKINWTSKDGFLCLDLNGNGEVDNGGEVFGDNTLLADGTTARNGFEALAQYDSNGDGVIDANDEIFSQLKVWVDADGNGESGEGELKSLAELGIESISLNYDLINGETGTEAVIGNGAVFTYTDGTSGNIGELWVSADLFDTIEQVEIEIPDDIKALANVRSIGNVNSLHTAMALDETGELKALVEGFSSETDIDKRMELAEQILMFITGAKDAADGSRGGSIDAKQLAVIEAMLGENYVGTTGANPHSVAGPILEKAYADLLDLYYNELNAETHLKDYVQLLRYTENEDGTKTLNADLVNFVLEHRLAGGAEDAKSVLADITRYVQYLDNGGIKGLDDFVMNYAVISSEYAPIMAEIISNGIISDGTGKLIGAGDTDFLAGSDNAEGIYGYRGNDILIGGKGNDNLYGGIGDDTYIFNLGDGNDVIDEGNSNSAADKIIFGDGITLEDIRIDRSGDDMIIHYSETDSIILKKAYSDSYYWVESFEFADGTTVTLNDFHERVLTLSGSGKIVDYTSGYGVRDTIMNGSDEADSIYGYRGNDIITGGKGNDNLYGGIDDDTYIFNLGDGNDVLDETNSNSAADKIIFGEGVTLEDIRIDRNENDMIIHYSETDSITLKKAYSDSYYWVESFEFADGTTVTLNDFHERVLTLSGSGKIVDYTSGYGVRDTIMNGSDEADSIYGYRGNDIITGGKGNDNLYGGIDDDTYIFNLGDGNDVLDETNSNSKTDKVIFGDGITLEDIRIDRSGDDMIIHYSETDSIILKKAYSDSYYWVESFEFADGTTVTLNDFHERVLTLSGSGKIVDYTSGYGVRDTIMNGSDEADSIYGYRGNDIITGGKGNDNLYGGIDDDTYIFNLGDGNDVLDETNSNSKTDKVIFGDGITLEDIRIDRSGDDMIIHYSETDSIILKKAYSDSYYWVESFEFADGTTVTLNDFHERVLTLSGSGKIVDYTSGYGVRDTIMNGSDEADSIYGYRGNDIITGGKGNDNLYGGIDDDTYIFNLGDGNDVIDESNSNSAADKIAFGEGISIDDIIFSKSGNDMLVTFADTDDSITVIKQNTDSYYRIEEFITADGYSIDYSNINLLIQAMASFEADTGMSWEEAVEQGHEGVNDILNQMWVKTVS